MGDLLDRGSRSSMPSVTGTSPPGPLPAWHGREGSPGHHRQDRVRAGRRRRGSSTAWSRGTSSCGRRTWIWAAGPILPRAGDQVRDGRGTSVFVYEVNAPVGNRRSGTATRTAGFFGFTPSTSARRVMMDSGNNSNRTASARWASVVVTSCSRRARDDHPMGRGDHQAPAGGEAARRVHRRGPQHPRQYAEMERKIWFLEGKLSGKTSNSPRQSGATHGARSIGGGP